MGSLSASLQPEIIERRIFIIRNRKVMLSVDLARLYAVPVKVLIQAVKRNKKRFPSDFLFQLTLKEFKILKSQIVTSSWGGIRRAIPYAFTQEGISMLSGVLRSEQAIHANIAIMRAFVRFQQMILSNKDLVRRLDELERRYDAQFKVVFDAIRELMDPPQEPPKRIGFKFD